MTKNNDTATDNLEVSIKHKPYTLKVKPTYYGVEVSLYEDTSLIVMFPVYEELAKIPETAADLKSYVTDLIYDLKQLVPFLKKA